MHGWRMCSISTQCRLHGWSIGQLESSSSSSSDDAYIVDVTRQIRQRICWRVVFISIHRAHCTAAYMSPLQFWLVDWQQHYRFMSFYFHICCILCASLAICIGLNNSIQYYVFVCVWRLYNTL